MLCSLGVSTGQAQTRPDSDAYLGQKPPGNTPVVFAPGTISRGNIHSRLEISSDGREMFWNTVDMKTFSTRILSVRKVDGKWSEPQAPSFAQDGDTQGAVFSPDGKRLYFRRNTGTGWVAQHVERTASGWSAPRANGFAPSGSSSFTRSGRVYYSAGMTTKVWNTGIFGARYSAGGLSDAKPLDEIINVPNAIDYTPYVSPDETFLLFSSNRPLIGNKEDLFIHVTFRKSDGTWSTPQRVSDIPARFPSLSPDGRYLFFCGDDGNFYWVGRTLIDRLKAQAIPGDSLYLGQTPPGTTPKVFTLAVSANSFAAERIAISRDGTSIYYQELDGYTALDGKPHTERIKYYRFAGGRWNGPQTLFEGFIAPAFPTSEDTLFIQKVAGQAYYSVRSDTGWGHPIKWSSTLKYSHYLQVTTNGHYYASSMPANTLGGLDRSLIRINGSDTTATSLGLPVNTAGIDFDFFIARDESFMIVAGSSALTVSYHKKDGRWTNPKDLGKAINFGLGAWGPYVTNDNRYLFYTAGTKPDYSDTHVYWVSIGATIDSLRTTNYEPYLKTRIPNQSFALNQAFSYVIPDSTFIDDDGNKTLTYAATLSDGSPLPSWLAFNAATRTFSGQPSETGVLKVRVTATDKSRASAAAAFEIRAGP